MVAAQPMLHCWSTHHANTFFHKTQCRGAEPHGLPLDCADSDSRLATVVHDRQQTDGSTSGLAWTQTPAVPMPHRNGQPVRAIMRRLFGRSKPAVGGFTQQQVKVFAVLQAAPMAAQLHARAFDNRNLLQVPLHASWCHLHVIVTHCSHHPCYGIIVLGYQLILPLPMISASFVNQTETWGAHTHSPEHKLLIKPKQPSLSCYTELFGGSSVC